MSFAATCIHLGLTNLRRPKLAQLDRGAVPRIFIRLPSRPPQTMVNPVDAVPVDMAVKDPVPAVQASTLDTGDPGVWVL